MKYSLPTMMLLSLTLTAALQAQESTLTFVREGDTETYQPNADTGDLKISWGQETRVFEDAVGTADQAFKTLITFNNEPALACENAGSNTYFEVFYTLTLKGKWKKGTVEKGDRFICWPMPRLKK